MAGLKRSYSPSQRVIQRGIDPQELVSLLASQVALEALKLAEATNSRRIAERLTADALSDLLDQRRGRRRQRPSGLTGEDVLADLVAVHAQGVKGNDGVVFFPTPAGTRWGDVWLRFTDRHCVYITVKGVSGTYHFAQMGMANRKNAKPTEQWLLLERFAEGHGLLDWRSRDADRRHQKRKERLAKDLQRFFRIEGDPFVLEGDGWRTRFTVSVQ